MNSNSPPFVPAGTSVSGKQLHARVQQPQHGQTVVTGKSSGLKAKPKRQQANHLAGFHVNKPCQNQSEYKRGGRGQSQHKTTRKYVPPPPSLSKECFLATNFKYVVSPFSNFLQPGFYDPDCMVDWEDIHLAIAKTDDSTESCAICLEETFILPHLTQCGHIFCLICLLRYLASDFSKKCPVCSGCNISRTDLRPVLFIRSSSTVLKSMATFSLLSKQKSSLFPTSHDFSSESLLSNPDIQRLLLNKKGEKANFNNDCTSLMYNIEIPEIDSASSQFSHLCYATPQKLIRIANQMQKALDTFRKCCVEAGSAIFPCDSRGDVEYLPYIPEADSIIQSRKEALKLNQEKSGAKILMSSNVPQISKVAVSSTPIWLYQQQQGHLSFLHPLCMRALLQQQSQLQHSISSKDRNTSDEDNSIIVEDIQLEEKSSIVALENMCDGLPCTINGTVLDIDTCCVTQEIRKRYPFIRHLPLHTVFSLVEIDMSNVLLPSTYDQFRDQFDQREAERKIKRLKKQKQVRKEKKRANEIEAQVIADRRELFKHQENEKQNAIQSLLVSPAVGSIKSAPLHSDLSIESPSHANDSSISTRSDTAVLNSFANITELGVSNDKAFPTLGGEQVHKIPRSNIPPWGSVVAGANKSGDGTANSIGSGSTTKNKKGKNKFVSTTQLFATSSSRSYR